MAKCWTAKIWSKFVLVKKKQKSVNLKTSLKWYAVVNYTEECIFFFNSSSLIYNIQPKHSMDDT